MKPDISELSVEELKRLQEEAEALIASKKIKQSKMLIIKLSRLLKMGFSVEQLLEFGAQNVRKQLVNLLSLVTATKTMLKRLDWSR